MKYCVSKMSREINIPIERVGGNKIVDYIGQENLQLSLRPKF